VSSSSSTLGADTSDRSASAAQRPRQLLRALLLGSLPFGAPSADRKAANGGPFNYRCSFLTTFKTGSEMRAAIARWIGY
jgi:hypothetical protein